MPKPRRSRARRSRVRRSGSRRVKRASKRSDYRAVFFPRLFEGRTPEKIRREINELKRKKDSFEAKFFRKNNITGPHLSQEFVWVDAEGNQYESKHELRFWESMRKLLPPGPSDWINLILSRKDLSIDDVNTYLTNRNQIKTIVDEIMENPLLKAYLKRSHEYPADKPIKTVYGRGKVYEAMFESAKHILPKALTIDYVNSLVNIQQC